MTVVLAHPPAVAQPDTQVAEQDAGDVTGPPGAEHLPVPGVMAQKPDLGEDHRQERGHRQLPPRVAHHHEGRPSGRQHPDGDRDLPGVVPRAPLQQPGLLDLPGQLRVLAAAARTRPGPAGPARSRPSLLRGWHRELLGGTSRRSDDAPPGSWTQKYRASGRVMHAPPARPGGYRCGRYPVRAAGGTGGRAARAAPGEPGCRAGAGGGLRPRRAGQVPVGSGGARRSGLLLRRTGAFCEEQARRRAGAREAGSGQRGVQRPPSWRPRVADGPSPCFRAFVGILRTRVATAGLCPLPASGRPALRPAVGWGPCSPG